MGSTFDSKADRWRMAESTHQYLSGAGVELRHVQGLSACVPVGRPLVRLALCQEQHRESVLLQTQHCADVWVEAGEDDLAHAGVLQHHLQNMVDVAVQLERVVQLERTVLEDTADTMGQGTNEGVGAATRKHLSLANNAGVNDSRVAAILKR